MADTVKQSKLIQYLSEAYGKERELETALQAHIAMTTRRPYKKRLQEHLKETKGHARQLERRIKKLGGEGPQLADKVAGQAVGKAKSLAKGPMHMVRGVGDAEKMLKNAKTEYWNEHEEIATYTAIETLARSVGDLDTAKLARAIRREEERMANFLSKQIPVLTKAVVTEEVPAAERRRSGGRSRSGAKASAAKRSAGSRSASARSGGSKRKASTASTRSAGARTAGSKSASSRSKSSGSKSASSRSKSSGSKSASSRSKSSGSKSASSRSKRSGSGSSSSGSRSRSR